MKKLLYLILISIPILFGGCDSEDDASLDKTVVCSKLAGALMANEEDNVKVQIHNLLNAQGDINALEESFEKLIEQIDSCPTLQVTYSCFGCIYTGPPQSEIRVTVNQNNQTISRVIDLSNRDTGLIFVGIHD